MDSLKIKEKVDSEKIVLEEKEYCPSCSEYVYPVNGMCPNEDCHWCLR